MRFAAGMTTAPRPVPTLFAALNSVVCAGFENVNVYGEPGSCTITSPMASFHSSRENRKLGSWGNFIRAVNHLTGTSPLRDAYAIFQDDIEVAEFARKFVEAHDQFDVWPGDPNTSILMLYTSRNNHSSYVGWHEIIKPTARYGLLGVIMPAETAHEFAKDHAELPTEPEYASDMKFAQWCDRRGYKQFFHSPSLIRHTGESSSIRSSHGLDHNRQCKRFAESAWDLTQKMVVEGFR
jgi:hypothetical protein